MEDEQLELDFLRSAALDEMGPEDKLYTCGTGVQAVKMAKQYRPDIIFMDILLPEQDGLSALQEIRKFLPDAYVVILSACSDFDYAQSAIDLKVIKYLLKPVKPFVFRQVFISALSQTSVLRISSSKEFAPPSPDEERQDFIEESIRYIHENFKEKLTLQMVASHVYMNSQYFSRMFKKETGTAYTDYVNNLKIQYACKLLETTGYPAYRISGECGFTDPSYFNRVFFRQMNMTPKEYKKEKRVRQGT